MSRYEHLFIRKNKQIIKEIDEEVDRATKEIANLYHHINELKEFKKNAEVEWFDGKPIIFETLFEQEETFNVQDSDKRHYELVVQIEEEKTDFRICAKAYPNAHDKGETFIAKIEEYGVNAHIPKWFKSNIKWHFTTFEAAKENALFMLEEMIHIANKTKMTLTEEETILIELLDEIHDRPKHMYKKSIRNEILYENVKRKKPFDEPKTGFDVKKMLLNINTRFPEILELPTTQSVKLTKWK